MSIYSGFATRFQQQSYDNCIDSLLYILQKRIIKFYQNEQADEEKFISLVLKLHHQMKNMEKSKYLEPKSSQAINELIKFMQVFMDNVPNKLDTEAKSKEELHQIEVKANLPQISNAKKKSIYWVQKAPAQVQSNQGSSERQAQTINHNNYNVVLKDGNIQFRKTSYNPAHLRGVKVRNGSKSNLSKQRKERKQLAEVKPPRNRSISGYLQDKPLVQSKATHYAQSFREQTQQAPQKRKNKSNARINQVSPQTLQTPDNQTQVADIIRQYIIKAKKNHIKGRGNADYRDPNSKFHDF